jgi:hypothetical protein
MRRRIMSRTTIHRQRDGNSVGKGVCNRPEAVLEGQRATPQPAHCAIACEAIGWFVKEPFVSALSQRLPPFYGDGWRGKR